MSNRISHVMKLSCFSFIVLIFCVSVSAVPADSAFRIYHGSMCKLTNDFNGYEVSNGPGGIYVENVGRGAQIICSIPKTSLTSKLTYVLVYAFENRTTKEIRCTLFITAANGKELYRMSRGTGRSEIDQPIHFDGIDYEGTAAFNTLYCQLPGAGRVREYIVGIRGYLAFETD